MGQKINPISLRIPIHRKMDSFWFDDKNYKHKLFQEMFIRTYIESIFHFLKKYPTKLIIRHFPHKISIYGFFLPWNSFNKGFRYQTQKIHFSLKKKQSLLRKKKIQPSFHNYYQSNPEFLFFSEGFLNNKQNILGLLNPERALKVHNRVPRTILIQEKLNFYNIVKNFPQESNINIQEKTIFNKYNSLEKLNLFFLRKKYKYPLVSVKLQIHWLILQLWKSQKIGQYLSF